VRHEVEVRALRAGAVVGEICRFLVLVAMLATFFEIAREVALSVVRVFETAGWIN
jgi:hypothetical protein